MTLLRAIPFSFNILWRMVLVFPFMVLTVIVFGIIAAIFIFITLFISPIAAIVMGVAFGIGSSILPVIVGSRLGLQAKHASFRNSYFGLILPAIGYGMFEVFCILLILAGCVGIYLFATPLTGQDLLQLTTMDEAVLLEQLMSVNPAITLSLFWVGGVMMIGLRAALLMPIAGASIGADPGGRAHTPFYGFGREFISLLILVAIAYILSTFTIPLTFMITFALGFGENLATAFAQLETSPDFDLLGELGMEFWIFVGIAFLIYLLAFSLQSAGGVLAYINEAELVSDRQNAFDMSMDAQLEPKAPSAQRIAERQVQSEDVMELIRSRMQQNKRQ